MLKRIFVPLEALETSEALLKQSVTYGKLFEAHMDVLRAVPVPRPRMANPLLASWPVVGNITSFPFVDQESIPEIKDYVRRYEAEVEASRQAYRDIHSSVCKAAHIPIVETAENFKGQASSSWISYGWGEADAVVSRYARISDISIVARPLSDDKAWLSSVIHHILFDAAKPLLLLPVDNKAALQTKPPKHMAIAWNGSSEASHAVSAALPLLKTAEKVTILTYNSKKTEAAAADDLKIWLKTHDIKAEKVIVDQLEITSVGAAILSEIEEKKIDMLITGAYGHSRMREFVLGGVTTYLLSRCPIALFMSH